jgi:hypothetical protein
VEEKVKPERDVQKRKALRERWWQFAEKRRALRVAIADLDRVVVATLHQPNWGVTFLPTPAVYSHALAIFAFDTYAAFCALQSRPHEVWARFFGSSMKDDLRYTPSDCFETFPLPDAWESDPNLEAAGHAYYEHRAALMVANDEGLTKTYNRFHDPYEHDPGIEGLRELHADMDRAVLAAYGWSEIPTQCEFLLDYEIDEEWGSKRKPYRYRWPGEVRDEVLARLIALNGERAAAEQRSGEAAAKPKGRSRQAVAASVQAEGLF